MMIIPPGSIRIVHGDGVPIWLVILSMILLILIVLKGE